MKHTITSTDLIRYLYNEVSYMEKLAIEKELQDNEALRSEYLELCESSSFLESAFAQVEMQPDENSIQHILDYRNSSRLETELF